VGAREAESTVALAFGIADAREKRESARSTGARWTKANFAPLASNRFQSASLKTR